ncbi:hypothetical protein SDC9_03524 [bioreactor metagenome]|uniref:Uncharacterized protein n=1 Tax=bioreactor metagenome TaxID=1076179 RepID=A0A644STJ1_9ZZZZ|nr:hypothetical protein [Methanobrevibacter sp.]MEA4956143.1 hypothetical protein [Methanobrevibacter sp.]
MEKEKIIKLIGLCIILLIAILILYFFLPVGMIRFILGLIVAGIIGLIMQKKIFEEKES